ncbi:hypothetical protein [Rhizorhabdus sp. FW153]|uniref:hypothetical protein n=1 Tax=Rhizorhabdus sp. FW153 TaxID=3400216 RepID=UPI003CED2078
MFRALRTDRHFRGIFAALLFCVLALRVAVPTGFMPTQADHGLVITVCNGMGVNQTVVIDLPQSGDADHSGHKTSEHKPCIFASASLPLLSGDAPEFSLGPALLLREFALPPPVGYHVVRTDFATPPLRGPPALT